MRLRRPGPRKRAGRPVPLTAGTRAADEDVGRLQTGPVLSFPPPFVGKILAGARGSRADFRLLTRGCIIRAREVMIAHL
jgi:hypothetical protein